MSGKYLPNIEIKVEDLPSRGISYPKGSVVTYQTYTFGEVQKSSNSHFTDLKGVIELAMDGISTRGFKKDELSLFDVFFIGLHRKASSLGSAEFEMPYLCRGCQTKQTINFSQNDIEFKDIDDMVTELPAVLEIEGQDVHFGILTVGDFLSKYDSKRMDATITTALMVKNMPYDVALKLVANTRDKQAIEDISEIDKLLAHDILPIKATCKNKDCGFLNHIKLEGREALLRPFRIGRESAKSRIRFGQKQPSEHISDQTSGVHGSSEHKQTP